MVNKTDVSNQITGLRPKVKQAAVFMAHHNTKEIKKCEVRKGPKAQKFKNKAETLRKESALLKKIRPDTVSRYALLMDFKDREKLLGDINLPFETKVIIKLATQKPVVCQVEEFRAQHPDWKSKVPQLLETLGIRAKFKKKVQKEQEKQARKLARRQELSQDSKSPSSEEASEDDDGEPIPSKKSQISKTLTKMSLPNAKTEHDQSADSDSDMESGSSDDADSDNDSDNDDCNDEHNSFAADDFVSSDDNSVCSNENLSSDENDELLEDARENVHKVVQTNFNSVTSKQKRKANLQVSSGSKFAVVRRLADLQKEADENERKPMSDSYTENDGMQENEASETEPVEEDTFFMTGENRFLKTVAVKRQNGEGLNSLPKVSDVSSDTNASQWAIDGKNLKGNRAQRRAKFLGKDSRKLQGKDKRKMKELKSSSEFRNSSLIKPINGENDYSKIGQGNSKFSIGKPDSFSKQRGVEKAVKSKKDILNAAKPDAGESLHPSWEAKRKQKVSLENFQGKKIKFDD